MEYSVGSLADLITGKNTPNKPKVVRKTIKTTISTSVEETVVQKLQKVKNPKKVKTPKEGKVNNTAVVSKIKKEKPTNDAGDSVVAPKNVKKKMATNAKLNGNNAEIKTKKNKKNKRPVTEENSTDKEHKKAIKRKVDGEENQAESPKKLKLTKSETNAAKRVLYKERELQKDNPEDNARTIYIGNIPILNNKLDHTEKKLKQHFRPYGIIESVRFRGIPVADPKTPKKVAAIKSEFNEKRNTVYGFIRFKEADNAVKAQEENGKMFMEHHLRVHLLTETEKPDESKAVFIGNLSFDAIEDDLWKLFEPCGTIENIRIIRDGRTGMGKGFAYVNFADSDSVQLALELEKPTLGNRELRISLCNLNMAKKNKKKNRVAKISKPGKPKFRTNLNRQRNGDGTKDGPKVEHKPYQGAKFNDNKKKKKFNKGDQQKKKLIKKIAPKTD